MIQKVVKLVRKHSGESDWKMRYTPWPSSSGCDCLASWATKNWNIAHSRPENFIFIGLTPTTHSIKYVCILGTDLHYSNYLAH